MELLKRLRVKSECHAFKTCSVKKRHKACFAVHWKCSPG